MTNMPLIHRVLRGGMAKASRLSINNTLITTWVISTPKYLIGRTEITWVLLSDDVIKNTSWIAAIMKLVQRIARITVLLNLMCSVLRRFIVLILAYYCNYRYGE